MAIVAERKCQVLRVLYEHWAAPIALLAELSGEDIAAFNAHVRQENWQVKNAVVGLQRRLSEIVDAQMVQLSEEQAAQPDLEKSARAIPAIAKTMESLANVALKLGAMEERTLDQLKSEIDDVKNQSTTDDTLALDHKIEALVGGLEANRKSVSSHEDMAG